MYINYANIVNKYYLNQEIFIILKQYLANNLPTYCLYCLTDVGDEHSTRIFWLL